MDINSMSEPAIGGNTLPSASKPSVEVVKPQQIEASVATSALEQRPVTKSEMLEMVDKANLALEQLDMGISFSVDEGTQSSVIKVIDRQTDEVIRQFPNEGSLKMMKTIQSYLDSMQQNSLPGKEGLTGVLFSEII
ncbi:MAG: flagellar protein FlaG [Gammaproteobacteria bacterium]|nr:flagellar protein FlaG [Gammaproteobacteria bacterium]